MGKITGRRADRTTFEVRTSVKTKSIRTATENPLFVDLSAIGDVPAVVDVRLSSETSLETVDLAPLAGQRFQSLTAHVARPIDLTPLAKCRGLEYVTFSIDEGVIDFSPLAGHATLKRVSIDCCGEQPALDLSFVRTLPALTDLAVAGGEWRTLDLEPLRGLPLRSLSLTRQYVSSIDLSAFAQPALTHLMLQDLEIRAGYLDLMPLSVCKDLQFLSLLSAEIGTIDVSGIAKLPRLARFDAPNFKSMMMSPTFAPIAAPGLARWKDNIGVE
jgi:hypothetical protein